MLSDFQQALAEITASPGLCVAVRRDPLVLTQRYTLSDRERRQVLAVAHHPSMSCACSLYRANRLAPLMRNLPHTIGALTDRLEAVLGDYWQAHPWPYRYGYLESERFCRWLEPLIAADDTPPDLRRSWQDDQRGLQERVSRFLAASGLIPPTMEEPPPAGARRDGQA